MRRVLLLACIAAGCGSPPLPELPQVTESEIPRDSVVAVLYLVGDAGAHPSEAAPVLHRLRADIEGWSAALARDSSVVVLFLGDNAYPVGVRPRSHPDFPDDSARLHAQVWTVSGENARSHGARGLFLPGNHDWGNAPAPAGLERLGNEQAQLEAHASLGAPVRLVPPAGEPGPTVIDVGNTLRVVALDTPWWLQTPDADEGSLFAEDVERALREADERTVVVAAHHPNVSAGPHGGGLWPGLNPVRILGRAGVLVQDLNSRPYRDLIALLRGAFEEAGPPFLYAAGHDHSLQVLQAEGPGQPRWTLVSGAASKLTAVGRDDALIWASEEAGYMRLLFDSHGRVDLYVESVPGTHLHCGGAGDARDRCVESGVEAFQTTYFGPLR